MSWKSYSELEIAQHSIMLEGIPKHIPKEKVEAYVSKIFKELLHVDKIDESQVVAVRSIAELHQCHKWIKKLRLYCGKFSMTQKFNIGKEVS